MGPEVLPTFRLQTISESGLVGRFEPSLWAEERAVAGLYLQTSGPGGICVATGLAESTAPTIEYRSRRFVPG